MYRVLWGELRRYIGTFFGARLSCRGIGICLDFGLRTPRGFSPVAFFFRGSGVSSLLLSLLLLLLLFLSGGRPGWLFLLFLGASCRTTPDSRYQYRREQHSRGHVFSFSLSPGRSPPPLFFLLLPSLSLSFSLSLLLSLLSQHA